MTRPGQSVTPLSGIGTNYPRGALLVASAAVLWSTAGLLTRWAATDPWTTLFWRAIFAAVALLSWMRLSASGQMQSAFSRLGVVGLGLALCLAGSMIAFINALALTTVANVMVFQAISPLFAALLAWVWLHERLTSPALVAIAVALAGTLLMVWDDLEAGRLAGDALGLFMAATFALTIVLARVDRHVSMAAATIAGMVVTAVIALPMTRFVLPMGDFLLLALFGIGQMALALVLFTTGVRLIPAADAGLIGLLECVLAPLWVWIVFAEAPDILTVIGGGIVLGAIVISAFGGRAR